MTSGLASATQVVSATWTREFLAYRLNRFLFLHLGLMAAIGVLALLAPPAAATSGAAWWVLNGVIYVASLSALLLGLSSAQSEAEEFAMLFTQPLRFTHWVAGKCAALLSVVAAAAILLVLPTMGAAGASRELFVTAGAAAAVTTLMAWIGLALGLWIVDPVRGLISALAAWCVLVFGIDLVLIVVGGAAWVQAHPGAWVAALMFSPLDAYRVMLLFVVERAAFAGAPRDGLTVWWLDHPVAWLAVCLGIWCVAVAGVGVLGASRRRTR